MMEDHIHTFCSSQLGWRDLSSLLPDYDTQEAVVAVHQQLVPDQEAQNSTGGPPGMDREVKSCPRECCDWALGVLHCGQSGQSRSILEVMVCLQVSNNLELMVIQMNQMNGSPDAREKEAFVD
mgnify:CR=1 FL=1